MWGRIPDIKKEGLLSDWGEAVLLNLSRSSGGWEAQGFKNTSLCLFFLFFTQQRRDR